MVKNNIDIIAILKSRFDKNMSRHPDLDWDSVASKLVKSPKKLNSLLEMETSGGEPDVVGVDPKSAEYIFMDCSPESPRDRRSLCYDRPALDARKSFKPKNSALDLATSMGINLLNEDQYRYLQTLGSFDLKTSSWLQTPAKIRQLGGAIFADRRYDTVFVYHNGADSYYASRGFRGILKV